jgi:hypothetical protein
MTVVVNASGCSLTLRETCNVLSPGMVRVKDGMGGDI